MPDKNFKTSLNTSLVLEEALEDVPDERGRGGHAHRRRGRLRRGVPRSRVDVVGVVVQLCVVRRVVLVVPRQVRGCTRACNVDVVPGIERGDIDDGQAGEIVLVRRPL